MLSQNLTSRFQFTLKSTCQLSPIILDFGFEITVNKTDSYRT